MMTIQRTFADWEFLLYQRACPYYVTRENQNTADIIFVPYNYLIDASARKAQNIDVNNAIIIFDEAHNLVRRFFLGFKYLFVISPNAFSGTKS